MKLRISNLALYRVAVAVLLVLALWSQGPSAKPTSIPDITGDAATHQLQSSGFAKWVLIIPLAANSAKVRIGDSATSATRGAEVAPGGGLFMPPFPIDTRQSVQQHRYDLSAIYYFAATGDKISVIWGN